MKVKLEDYVDFSNNHELLENVDINNYVSTENLKSDRNGVEFPAKNLPTSKKVTTYQKNDILVSNIRPYFKKIWKADCDGPKSNDVLAFRTINSRLLQEYLYIVLQSDNFFDYVTNTSKGTKMPRGDKNAIKHYEFELPTIEYQRKISNAILKLEDKMKLNNQINDNLLKLLDTEFSHRFINNSYHSNGKVDEFVNIKRGASPRPIKDFLSDKGRAWIKISDVTKLTSPFLYDTGQFIKESGIDKSRTIKPGTLILSNSATPGIPIISEILASVHDGWLIISDYTHMDRNWFYLFFRQMRKQLVARANGSVFNNLKTDIVKNFPVPIPNAKELLEFKKVSNPMFDRLNQLQQENIVLNAIKKSLLNKYF